MLLAQLLAGFQSLPLLPTSKLGPSGADSQVGGFVYVLRPWGSLQRTLLWGWSFSHRCNPHRVFSVRGFFSQRFWGFISLPWNPGSHGLSRSPGCSSSLSTHKCGTSCSTSCHLLYPVHQPQPSRCPLHLGCLCLPLLQDWMTVSSLIPPLSDFHTIRFSVSSGYFLFLNLLLFFFWLSEEAQCIYLHLHLGWKSTLIVFLKWHHTIS